MNDYDTLIIKENYKNLIDKMFLEESRKRRYNRKTK